MNEIILQEPVIETETPGFQGDLEESEWGSIKITRKNEVRYGLVIVTDSYTVRTNDRYILVNQTTGTKTITLPESNTGKVFTIKAQTANQVDIVSSDNIDGVGTQSITSQYGVITVVFDGTTWNIV